MCCPDTHTACLPPRRARSWAPRKSVHVWIPVTLPQPRPVRTRLVNCTRIQGLIHRSSSGASPSSPTFRLWDALCPSQTSLFPTGSSPPSACCCGPPPGPTGTESRCALPCPSPFSLLWTVLHWSRCAAESELLYPGLWQSPEPPSTLLLHGCQRTVLLQRCWWRQSFAASSRPWSGASRARSYPRWPTFLIVCLLPNPRQQGRARHLDEPAIQTDTQPVAFQRETVPLSSCYSSLVRPAETSLSTASWWRTWSVVMKWEELWKVLLARWRASELWNFNFLFTKTFYRCKTRHTCHSRVIIYDRLAWGDDHSCDGLLWKESDTLP